MKLIITSLGFLIPFAIALKRRKRKDAVMSGTLVCTSILNHGTSNQVLRIIDITYVHGLFLYFAKHVHLKGITRACLYLSPYIYYTKCRRDTVKAMRYHMMLHVLGIIGWTAHL